MLKQFHNHFVYFFEENRILQDDIIFEGQKEEFNIQYGGDRPTGDLKIRCYGDYSYEEILKLKKGEILCYDINLKIYWNTIKPDDAYSMFISGTFEKANEENYKNIVDEIESL